MTAQAKTKPNQFNAEFGALWSGSVFKCGVKWCKFWEKCRLSQNCFCVLKWVKSSLVIRPYRMIPEKICLHSCDSPSTLKTFWASIQSKFLLHLFRKISGCKFVLIWRFLGESKTYVLVNYKRSRMFDGRGIFSKCKRASFTTIQLAGVFW